MSVVLLCPNKKKLTQIKNHIDRNNNSAARLLSQWLCVRPSHTSNSRSLSIQTAKSKQAEHKDMLKKQKNKNFWKYLGV